MRRKGCAYDRGKGSSSMIERASLSRKGKLKNEEHEIKDKNMK